MSIKSRLTLIIALLLGTLVFQAAVTLYFRGVNDGLTSRLSSAIKNTAEIGAVSTEVQKMRRFEKEYFIYVNSPEKRRGYDADVRKASLVIDEHLTRMAANREKRYTAAEAERFAGWERDLAFYTAEFIAIVQKVENGELATTAAANAAIGPGKDRLKKLIDGSAQDGAERQAASIQDARLLNDNRSITTTAFAATTGIAILVGLFSLFMLRRIIVRPLQQMADVADRVSQGETGVVFPEQHVSEFSSLAESLERMRAAMNKGRAVRGAA